MTSNRPLEDWGKLLGDVPSAIAILDRFLHDAAVLSITGRSYLLKDRTVEDGGIRERAPKTKKQDALPKTLVFSPHPDIYNRLIDRLLFPFGQPAP